jgi:hypothetical protein
MFTYMPPKNEEYVVNEDHTAILCTIILVVVAVVVWSNYYR